MPVDSVDLGKDIFSDLTTKLHKTRKMLFRSAWWIVVPSSPFATLFIAWGILLQGWAKLSMADIEGEADSVELEKFCRDKVRNPAKVLRWFPTGGRHNEYACVVQDSEMI